MIQRVCRDCQEPLTIFDHTCDHCGSGNYYVRCLECGKVLTAEEMQLGIRCWHCPERCVSCARKIRVGQAMPKNCPEELDLPF